MFGHNLIRREEYCDQHIRNPKVRQNKQCCGDTFLIFYVPKSQMVPGVAGIFRVARSAPVAAAVADIGAIPKARLDRTGIDDRSRRMACGHTPDSRRVTLDGCIDTGLGAGDAESAKTKSKRSVLCV